MTIEDNGIHFYECLGLFIRSEFCLPELPVSFTQCDQTVPVVDIRIGGVSPTLKNSQNQVLAFQVDGDDVLLTVEGTARYLVRGGREIIVDPAPGASDRNIRLFLLGSALGILCHQRGLLPLHANVIVANGKAIAFAGHSGAGKSTLAGYFMKAGYDVLADDVCVLSFDEAGRPLAWPGLPRLKLWSDAIASLGHDPEGLDRAIEGAEKYHVPFSRAANPGPFPFQALYLLDKAKPGELAEITQLRGADAYQAISLQTYRYQYLAPMGLRKRHFDQIMTLLKHAPVYRAPRRWGFDVFAEETQKFERHFAAV